MAGLLLIFQGFGIDWAPPNPPNYKPTHTRYLVRTCSKVPKKEACCTQIRCEIENLCHILIVDVIAFPNSVKVINQHFKLKWILFLLIPIRRLYPKNPSGAGSNFVNPESQAPTVLATGLLLIILSTLCVCTRWYTSLKSTKKLHLDDCKHKSEFEWL